MKTPFHIEIPKRNATCAKNGEKFVSGMDYYSLLSENDLEKIIRHDYCATCWSTITASRDLSKSRGYWKSTIEPKDKALPSTRAERALLLLKNLLSSQNPPETEIFVLVLLLSHMRKLILRKEFVEESIRYGLYELLHQDEFIKVKFINLSPLEIEQTQLSLAAQLKTLSFHAE